MAHICLPFSNILKSVQLCPTVQLQARTVFFVVLHHSNHIQSYAAKPASKEAKKAANKAKAAKAARTNDKKSRNVRKLSSIESRKQGQERSTRSSGQHNEISVTLDDPSDFESCRNKMLVDSDELTHPPSSTSSRTQSVSSYATVIGDDDIAVIGDKTEFNILSGDNTNTEIFVVNMDKDGFTKALGKKKHKG